MSMLPGNIPEYLIYGSLYTYVLCTRIFFMISNNKSMRILLLGSIVLLLSGCFATDSQSVKKEERPNIPVITLQAEDTILNTNYVATVQAIRNVEVRTKIGGSLEKILVDEGRFVKKGQAMFELNKQVFAVELERARA